MLIDPSVGNIVGGLCGGRKHFKTLNLKILHVWFFNYPLHCDVLFDKLYEY